MAKEERTEKPTAKRRKESRKKGQVARTPELGAWGSLLIIVMMGPLLVGKLIGQWQTLMVRALHLTRDPTVSMASRLLVDAARQAVITIVIFGVIIMVINVVATLAQGGFFIATESMKPSWKKFNPIEGFKRLLGPQAWWMALKMIVKSAVIGFVAYVAIKAMVPLLGSIVPMQTTIQFTTGHVKTMFRWGAVVGVLMAAADYAVAFRRTSQQTKMTKEEVKQENKQTEGDPLVKGAIRARQLQAARNRMMADVPDADVVMVNPTHVAVALAYNPGTGAPKVVARGAGEIAAKIRELATENDVPLVRDVPLARALYHSTKVGQEIPPQLFGVVAEVLAFVIGRKSRGQGGGSFDSPRTDTHVPHVPRRRRTRTTTPTSPGRSSSAIDATSAI